MKLNPVRQKVWKVVHVSPTGSLMSLVYEFLDSKYLLEYRQGQLVKPKIGKIFAFDSLEAATCFYIKQGVSENEIWQAEAYGCEYLSFRALTNDFENNVCHFWSRVMTAIKQGMPLHIASEWSKCPNGTVGCRALKLIKKY